MSILWMRWTMSIWCGRSHSAYGFVCVQWSFSFISTNVFSAGKFVNMEIFLLHKHWAMCSKRVSHSSKQQRNSNNKTRSCTATDPERANKCRHLSVAVFHIFASLKLRSRATTTGLCHISLYPVSTRPESSPSTAQLNTHSYIWRQQWW